MQEGDIEYLQTHGHAAFGCQAVPRISRDVPTGYGTETYEEWSWDGEGAAAHIQGQDVYTDGSCLKEGHSPFFRAGCGVARISELGELVGARWGRVGTRLPR